MSTRYIVLTGLSDEMIDPTLPKADDVNGPLYGLNQWLSLAISQEPTDIEIAGDLPKRGPVTRWLGYAFGNPRITHAEAQLLLPLQPGDPNPFFQIIDAINREQGTVSLGSSPLAPASASPVNREIWRTPEYAVALVLTGGDAENLPVFFGVADTSATCPFSDQSETWAQYFSSQVPKVSGGVTYYENIEAGQRYYAASEWFPYYMAGAMQVISVSEYRDLVVDE